MKRLAGMAVLLSLLVGTGYLLAWAVRVNDHISRCFDDYDPAYIADEALRRTVCGDEAPISLPSHLR